MDLDAIVESIDAEIARLERLRVVLTGYTAPLERGFHPSGGGQSDAETPEDERGRIDEH
jgi:hypothetical protein